MDDLFVVLQNCFELRSFKGTSEKIAQEWKNILEAFDGVIHEIKDSKKIDLKKEKAVVSENLFKDPTIWCKLMIEKLSALEIKYDEII